MQNRTLKNIIALTTLVRREVRRFSRIWLETILPSAVTVTLYFIIFGKLIGAQLKDIHGYNYIDYIAPGLIMMSAMTNAYSNTASSFFSSKFNRSIEEMLVSPMPNIIILLGFMIGGVLRGICVGLVILLIALLFTHIPIYSFAIAITMTLLACMVFSLAGLINAIFAKKFDDISFIPTFVLTPLTYLGGVFYSIKQLPLFWQKISILNPVLNIVDTFRYGMLGVSDVNAILGFCLVGLFLLVVFLWSLYLLNKGVGIRT